METKRSTIVVADSDSWVRSALSAVMAPDGFDVIAYATARDAFNACCALVPDGLVTELALPDRDGLWLTARIREEPGPVARMTILMAAVDRDERTRIAALNAGADVFVAKPLRILEVAAQVKALVAMSHRLQAERPSVLPPVTAQPQAIHGDLSRMTVATVLGALELERRSGDLVLLEPTGAQERLVLELASGLLVSGKLSRGAARIEPLSSIEALRRALDWAGHRFEFAPKNDRTTPRSAESFGKLMFRLMQANDPRASLLSVGDLEAPPAAQQAPASKSGTRPKPPPLPRAAQQPPSSKSGTRPKPPPPPSRASGVKAPGRSLVEPVAPSRRADPRAEPEEPAQPPWPAPKLAKR
jgi:DNA-binding response OmpR family regulator